MLQLKIDTDLLDSIRPPLDSEAVERKVSEGRRWFDIVDDLVKAASPSSKQVSQALDDALIQAAADSEWAGCSGIIELLTSAKIEASKGFIQSARRSAKSLLDFHQVVLKYKQQSSPGGRSSSVESR